MPLYELIFLWLLICILWVPILLWNLPFIVAVVVLRFYAATKTMRSDSLKSNGIGLVVYTFKSLFLIQYLEGLVVDAFPLTPRPTPNPPLFPLTTKSILPHVLAIKSMSRAT